MYDYHGQAPWLFPLVDTMRTDYLLLPETWRGKSLLGVVRGPSSTCGIRPARVGSPHSAAQAGQRLLPDCVSAGGEPMSRFYLNLERWKWNGPGIARSWSRC